MNARRLFALIVGSLLTVAACTTAGPTGSSATPAPTGPHVLTISQSTEPPTLDPHADSARFSLNVARQVFDNLIIQDRNAKLTPGLALSWSSVDPTTWEFKLRPNVKFHDGSPFSADDVKFSFDRILNVDNKLPVRAAIAVIKSVNIVDPMTVRIVTNGADTILPLRVSHSAMIIPMKTFQAMGDKAFAQKPIGTGPFKFVEWVPNERIVYDANTEYWAGRPKLDRLIWKNISETSTRMSALKTGQVDIANQVPVQEIAGITADSKLRISTVAGNIVVFWIMDTTRPPLNDKRVRQALNYAIDRQSIAKNIFGSATLSLLGNPNTIFGLDPAQTPYPYDPTKAKQLLAEAGYPNGFDLPVNASSAGMTQDDKSNLQAVVSDLSKVGIKAQTQVTEFATLLTKWRALELRGITLLDYGYSVPHLDVMLATYVDSTRAPAVYINKPLEAQIAEARSTFDQTKQLDLYKQIQAAIKEDAPLIFMYTENISSGVNKRVKNFEVWPNDWVWAYPLDVEP